MKLTSDRLAKRRIRMLAQLWSNGIRDAAVLEALLEVGTGSGYAAAILAEIAAEGWDETCATS